MPDDDKKAPAYETASSRDALFAERRNSIRLKGRRDVHEPVDLKAERMKRQTSSESAASASQSGRTAEEQEELEQLNAALLAAAREGDEDEVELMIDSGAEVEAADWAGCTALIIAAAGGHEDAVAVLLEKRRGTTPSTAAARRRCCGRRATATPRWRRR